MRRAAGSIKERVGVDGATYRVIRFSAYGKRRGISLGAVSRDEAERTLRGVLADVERGLWKPAPPPAPEPEGVPTFHEFAEAWWVRNEPRFRPSTQADYRWRLERYLLPAFGDVPVDAITIDSVERFISDQLRAAEPLSPRSINMMVGLLASILDTALERDLIARNPARGKRRRVREPTPRRTYLDRADQVTALLDAAGELDREARVDRRHVHRRAILATLTFAGLRIGELTALRWADVDLASGWLSVGQSKTDAGIRRIRIRAALRDELLRIKPLDVDPARFVFATGTGARSGSENVRNRVLALSVARANERLAAAGLAALPDGLTPHSLRRTFTSVLYAIGVDPGTVMDELGHTDPALALRVYRQSMRRDDGERDALRRLVEGAAVDERAEPAVERVAA